MWAVSTWANCIGRDRIIMTNKQKVKGTAWEREAVKRLNEYVNVFKRIPGSGSLGTILNEPKLAGDIQGKTKDFFNKNFVLEAKTGYGGAKQLTIQKEWFDKVAEEADSNFAYAGVICKFADARSGVRHFVAFDLDVFGEMLRYVETLSNELNKVYEELAEKENE